MFLACERGFSIRASGDEEAVGVGGGLGARGGARTARSHSQKRIPRKACGVQKGVIKLSSSSASVSRSKEWVGCDCLSGILIANGGRAAALSFIPFQIVPLVRTSRISGIAFVCQLASSKISSL